MKKILFILLAIIASVSVKAQVRDTTKAVKDTIVPEPMFPGGMDNFGAFLVHNIIYPNDSREKKIQGRVLLELEFQPDGKIVNIKALKGPSPDIIAEAIRVMKLSPPWIVGKDIKSNFLHGLPIGFSLGEE